MFRTVVTSFVVLATGGGLVVPSGWLPAATAAEPTRVASSWALLIDTQSTTGVSRADGPADAVVSPDGATVFVAGESSPWPDDSSDPPHYLLVAVDARTGERRWTATYHNAGGLGDYLAGVAMSPTGRFVYVTGSSSGSNQDDYETIAYNAVTGEVAWSARYDGPTHERDQARSIDVSPDASVVYVTGTEESSRNDTDVAHTVAYDATTGAVLWQHSFSAAGYDWTYARDVLATSSGVFVTAQADDVKGDDDVAIFAYSVAGDGLWSTTYDGSVQSPYDVADAIAYSPRSRLLYVAAQTDGNHSATTLAYKATTGRAAWSVVVPVTILGGVQPVDVVASPDGSRVYTTTYAAPTSGNASRTVHAYRAGSGDPVWATTYSAGGDEMMGTEHLAVSSDSAHVYATGMKPLGLGVTSLRAADGAVEWASARQPGVTDHARTVVAAPNSSAVYVVGWSSVMRDVASPDNNDGDLLVLADDPAGGPTTTPALSIAGANEVQAAPGTSATVHLSVESAGTVARVAELTVSVSPGATATAVVSRDEVGLPPGPATPAALRIRPDTKQTSDFTVTVTACDADTVISTCATKDITVHVLPQPLPLAT